VVGVAKRKFLYFLPFLVRYFPRAALSVCDSVLVPHEEFKEFEETLTRSRYSFLIIELNFPPFFQYTFQYVKKLTGLEMRQVSHTLLERAMVVICKIA